MKPLPSTKNFNPLTDKKLRCTCGHKECDQRTVNQKTLNRAQKGREIIGRPLTVTSGGRCPFHKNEVNRVVPADHQRCNVVDVLSRNGLERGELVKVGIEVGFNAIGVGKQFVHWGYRPELPEGVLVMWEYS